MADSFDNLMAGPNAVMGLARLAGNVRTQNQARSAQNFMANQEAFAMRQQQLDSSRLADLRERELAMQEMQAARDYALQREESAFDRLNQTLENQLKISENEAKKRDEAFKRSMQAQLFDLQTRQQSLQLEKLELESRRIDLQGKVRTRFIDFQSNNSNDSEAENFVADMKNLAEEYEDVLGLDDAAELATSISGMIAAAEQMPTRAVKVNQALIPGSESFSVGEINKVLESIDYTKPLDADARQAVSYVLNAALEQYDPDVLTEEQIKNIEADLDIDFEIDYNNISKEEKVRAAVMQYAMEKSMTAPPDGTGDVSTKNSHLRRLVEQLATPAGRVRFDSELSQGLYRYIDSPDTLTELQNIRDAQQREDAEMAAFYGPTWFSSEFAPYRQEMLDQYADREMDVLSDGNPIARRVMGGGIDDFNRMNEEVKREATLGFTRNDFLEFSGLAGTGRTLSNVFTLNWGALNWDDAFDLGMTALWFIPGGAIVRGGAWAVRGGAAGVRSISTGLKMQRTARVAGRIADSSRLAKPRPFAATANVLTGRPRAAVTEASEQLAQRQATLAAAQAERTAAVQSRLTARTGVQQARASQIKAQESLLKRAETAATRASETAAETSRQLNLARATAAATSKRAAFQQARSIQSLETSLRTANSKAARATERMAARRAALAQKQSRFSYITGPFRTQVDEAARAAQERAIAAGRAAAAPRQAVRGAAAQTAAARGALETAETAMRSTGRQVALEMLATTRTAAFAPIMVARKDSILFNELDEAASQMNETIYNVEAMMSAGVRDPRLLQSVDAALTNYRRMATKYYGGQLPDNIDIMLSLRNILSRSTFTKLQRANVTPQANTTSLAELRMQRRQASRGRMVPTSQTPGGGSSTIPSSGGFSFLDAQVDSE